jgi:hypothetical protein
LECHWLLFFLSFLACCARVLSTYAFLRAFV